jgi:hypothetical protein
VDEGRENCKRHIHPGDVRHNVSYCIALLESSASYDTLIRGLALGKVDRSLLFASHLLVTPSFNLISTMMLFLQRIHLQIKFIKLLMSNLSSKQHSKIVHNRDTLIKVCQMRRDLKDELQIAECRQLFQRAGMVPSR